MINRSSIISLLSLVLLLTIYAFLTRPPLCPDPAGCVRMDPNDPVEIGIGVVTTGVDRSLSVEIQQSLDLFAETFTEQSPDHPLDIQAFFSSCLPGVPAQSTIDLSANRNILAVIGPTCGEDVADFSQRMAGANQTAISPIPYRTASNGASISVIPDDNQLAIQASGWIRRFGFSRIIVLHDTDEPSTTVSTAICDLIRASGSCTLDVVGSPISQPDLYDAVVGVFLNESNPPQYDWLSAGLSIPRVMVSFSRPVSSGDQPGNMYWIGPQFWNEHSDFIDAFLKAYDHYPVSFASGVLYSRMPMIYNMVKQTAIIDWDGAWIVPLGALKKQIETAFVNDPYLCSSISDSCPPLALVGYQVSENEYKLANP